MNNVITASIAAASFFLFVPGTVLAQAQPAPSNPCAHRILCGPLRLVPKDPNERRAFYIRVGLQIADGIVTSAGLRSNRTIYPDLFRTTACVNPNTACYSNLLATRYHSVDGEFRAAEIDPIVQVFAHGGLRSMLLGGLVFDVASARITKNWSAKAREHLNLGLATTHAAGISTWLPILADRRATNEAYSACAHAAVNGFVAGKSGTKDGLALYLPPSSPASCQVFSSLPIAGF